MISKKKISVNQSNQSNQWSKRMKNPESSTLKIRDFFTELFMLKAH